ncbi:YscO family type III secretion system apparatus protein, partial [Vibrio parahaemolyticus]|nr:YscO family type III secretion system apparatus protein [Vibrio parahaemolyticus]
LKEKQKEARQAHKTKEKFVQLQQQEVAEKSRERQYQEELEQEEFRTVDII